MRVEALTFLFVSFVAQAVAAQAPAEIQRWFEAGQYQQIVDAVPEPEDPRTQYLAGLSYEKLDRPGDARRVFDSLMARPDSDPWAHIGSSAASLLDATMTAEAERAARRAIELGSGLSMAHYQLGLVHGRQKDYERAVTAFDAAINAEPRFAYAHYYAGLSYYQIDRTDKMASAFEYFLTLAPGAPERGQVASIMRTLRGR